MVWEKILDDAASDRKFLILILHAKVEHFWILLCHSFGTRYTESSE